MDFSTGNDVHHKCNTLNRAFSIGTPCRNNTNASLSFEFLMETYFHKPFKSMNCLPFQSLMMSNKTRASSFPFFAASDTSASARSALCSIPRPSAQHLASITMATASPWATQSSRSDTAFASSLSTPSPSISRLASSLFASMSLCAIKSSKLAAPCVPAVLFCDVVRSWWLRVFECERKKGESQSVKESCGFLELQLDLCFWFSTLSSLFPQPLSSKPPFFPSTHQQQSTHSTWECCECCGWKLTGTPSFHHTTPSFHTPLPSITLTTPLVLTSHSLCPTTAHYVSNDVMQIHLILQLTHHCTSSSLHTLNILIHSPHVSVHYIVNHMQNTLCCSKKIHRETTWGSDYDNVCSERCLNSSNVAETMCWNVIPWKEIVVIILMTWRETLKTTMAVRNKACEVLCMPLSVHREHFHLCFQRCPLYDGWLMKQSRIMQLSKSDWNLLHILISVSVVFVLNASVNPVMRPASFPMTNNKRQNPFFMNHTFFCSYCWHQAWWVLCFALTLHTMTVLQLFRDYYLFFFFTICRTNPQTINNQSRYLCLLLRSSSRSVVFVFSRSSNAFAPILESVCANSRMWVKVMNVI